VGWTLLSPVSATKETEENLLLSEPEKWKADCDDKGIGAQIASEILDFLSAHAKSKGDYDPRWDPEEDRFNGPDSSMLYAAASNLKKGLIPRKVHSDWGSGCYHPISDADAKAWHDRLVSQVNKMAKRDYAGPPDAPSSVA
jgi:hypothetical protein